MRQLCLVQLIKASTNPEQNCPIVARLDEPDASDATYGLFLRADGNAVAHATRAEHSEGGDGQRDEAQENGQLVAMLRSLGPRGTKEWYIVGQCGQLGLNGMVPALPVARLEPGSLLTVGHSLWLVCILWTPQPSTVPPELRHKPCAVCGGKLRAAPAIECVCGRWTHLQRPEEPHSGEALNCYLTAGKCGFCGRPATLEPQLVPEPNEKLLPPGEEERSWEQAAINA